MLFGRRNRKFSRAGTVLRLCNQAGGSREKGGGSQGYRTVMGDRDSEENGVLPL